MPQFRTTDARDEDVGGSCDREPLVVPAFALRLHLRTNAPPYRRILEPLDELHRATVMRPRRYERAHFVAPGGVGVQVRHDVDACGPRSLNLGDDFGHPTPHRWSSDLQMPDFDRNLRLPGDGERLIQRLHYVLLVGAHV